MLSGYMVLQYADVQRLPGGHDRARHGGVHHGLVHGRGLDAVGNRRGRLGAAAQGW